MRLERLTLAPYGRFADRTLTLRADAHLHVVLGANESGKTTTLAAIGDLLFGFPARTNFDFAHDQRLLRVGGLFRLADGRTLELRRRKGNANTLVDDTDKPVSDEPLRRALGGLDRKTFESEFGLTAASLREGGAALLRAGGGLAETLAASSAGLSALSRLRDDLAREAEDLFSTRRSASKAFYIALDRHKQADDRLRDAVVTADALQTANEAELTARAREVELKSRHEETGAVLAKLQRAQRTSAKLARLDALATELTAFADLPEIAEAQLAVARGALEAKEKLGAEIDALAADDAAERAEMAALVVAPALLEQAASIESLREKLGEVRKAAEDLPRRIEAHHGAESSLDDLAGRLGFPAHAEMLAALPSEPEQAAARARIEARRAVEHEFKRASEARTKAREERERLCATGGAEAVDPEPLRRRLAALSPFAADADRLRRERASHSQVAEALAQDAARLRPDGGEIDALSRRALPEPDEIATFERRSAAQIEAVRAAEARLEETHRAREDAERRVGAMQALGPAATRADWALARERREQGFEGLRLALDGEPNARRERLESAHALTLAADAVAEFVISDSASAARLQAEREQLDARRDEMRRSEADLLAARESAAEVESGWLALWRASGVAPLTPQAMARWRERVGALVERRANWARQGAEIEALAGRLAGARAELETALAGFGRAPPPDAPFDAAFRGAQFQCDELQRAFVEASKLAVARQRAERDFAEAETALERETAAMEAEMAAWPSAMAAVRQSAGAGVAEAVAALELWRATASPRQAMAREARSIEGIREDIAAFEDGVGAIVRAAAPDLATASAPEALTQLAARLATQRRAADARERLGQSLAARAARLTGLEARRANAMRTIEEMARRWGIGEADLMPSAAERAERRRGLEVERVALRRDLTEIADALDEAALRQEQATLDASRLPSQIEATRQSLQGLLHEIGEAASATRAARERAEALSRGRDAAGAAQERKEAAAELIEIAERWIVRQAAARLATRAIERHRAAAQDPLMARAGELFSVASAGAFSGLGADYDEADRPVLVALRANGERVGVAGLSEGARDQLFLALRLALLDRRAGEPLPFIGDDLLASFDDERTRRTLGLMVEFGRRRQAILFTHHAHVAALANSLGDSRIETLTL